MITRVLFSLLLCTQILAKIELTISVNVNDRFPAQDSLYVTGETKEFCEWRPNCIRMEKIADTHYQATVTLPSSMENISIQFTRGSWETQASYTNGHPLENTTIQLRQKNHYGEFVIPKSRKINFLKGLVHFLDLPKVVKTTNLNCSWIYSNQLQTKKEVCVKLPKNYFQSNKRYPVIYAFDGQNLFDSAKANYGVEWEVDENLEKLNREAIVVGFTSGKRRIAEYDYHQLGKLLAKFIIDDIMPQVNRDYRTLKSREYTYLMGSSMGAYLSFSILWNHSKYFSKAAAISLPGGIMRGGIYQVIAYKENPDFPIRAYIDYGKKGFEIGYPLRVEAFIRIMERLGYEDMITTKVFPYAGHHESDWARRLHIPLSFLLK